MSDRQATSRTRGVVAFLIGLVGALAIWIAVPYVNYVIGLRYMADSYLPAGAMLLILLLVLVVNPLLHRVNPRWRLDFRQTALIAGFWLCASVVPGTGLLQFLPYGIADVPRRVAMDRELAAIFKEMNLPPSLFPDEVRFNAPLNSVQPFVTGLLPGQPLPWGAWTGPLAAWGTWMLFLWSMMAGLAMILMPQWARNERLAFPLLTLQRSLIESPEPGRAIPPIFRKSAFWYAAGAVFVVHVLRGMESYFPERVPTIPLGWSVQRMFTEGFFKNLHAGIYGGYIYFILVGMAFFMPSRISFSIWFFTIAYALVIAVGKTYFPPFPNAPIYDQRLGAMIAVSLGVLWLGRAHWLRVLRCTIGLGIDSDESRRDRVAGWTLLFGCVGMFAWLIWVGVQPGWAVVYVLFGVMISMLMARIVAETGLPIIRFDLRYHIMFAKLAPVSWLAAPTLFFSGIVAMFYSSNIMLTTIGMHASGLDKEMSPRRHTRFFATILVLLMVGIVVSGASHLLCAYHHSETLDGSSQPINPRGQGRQLNVAFADVKAFRNGEVDRPLHNQWKHLVLGAGIAGFLQWACISMPRWPLHPIGLILVKSAYADGAWPSLFLGWLLKLLILKYGGSRLFRAAIPFMLGLMAGELFAVLFWMVVPTVLAVLGEPYIIINVLPPP
ncbi:hypothetical protein JW916_06645 [Candidatus Sumerlaeota bacterium]|nr:hypothetical protein [Candidatus Sumerlaeota bacterium]